MHGPVWEQTLVQHVCPARWRFYQRYCCSSSLKNNVRSHISASTCMRFTTLQPAAPQHRLLNPSFRGRGRWLLRHREVSAGWDLVIIYRSNCFQRTHCFLNFSWKQNCIPKTWAPILSHPQLYTAKDFHQKCHINNSTYICSQDTEISSESH